MCCNSCNLQKKKKKNLYMYVIHVIHVTSTKAKVCQLIGEGEDVGGQSGQLHCCDSHQAPFSGHGSPLPFRGILEKKVT